MATTPEMTQAFDDTMSGINCCDEHKAPFAVEEIDQKIAAYFDRGDYAESDGACLGRLKDGRFFVGHQSEDTTGHG
jgi:hypothetical protein